MRLGQRPQLGHRRHVGLAELGEPLPVLGRPLARDVEQVVADEDARQVDVGAQAPQLGVDLVVRVFS